MNVQLLSVAAVAVASLFAASCGGPLGKCGGPGPGATASLSAVTLANDCGSAKAAQADFAAGACAEGAPCPSFCRQSSMQLQLSAFDKATVQIVDVRLIDPKNGKVLEHLKSREPTQWNGDAYIAWDEILQPTVVLKASYKLSAPSYNYSAVTDSRFGYQSTYTVEVDVMIDGELHTVSAEATREPEVVT